MKKRQKDGDKLQAIKKPQYNSINHNIGKRRHNNKKMNKVPQKTESTNTVKKQSRKKIEKATTEAKPTVELKDKPNTSNQTVNRIMRNKNQDNKSQH